MAGMVQQVRGIAQQDSFLLGGVAIEGRIPISPPPGPYVPAAQPEEMSLTASNSASSSLHHPYRPPFRLGVPYAILRAASP